MLLGVDGGSDGEGSGISGAAILWARLMDHIWVG